MNLFGTPAASQQPSLVGPTQQQANIAQTPQKSLFGGAPTTTNPAQQSSLFGAPQKPATQPSLYGQGQPALPSLSSTKQPAGQISLFGGAAQPQAQPQQSVQQTSLFGGATGQAQQAQAQPVQQLSLYGQPSAIQPQQPQAATLQPTNSLFGVPPANTGLTGQQNTGLLQQKPQMGTMMNPQQQQMQQQPAQQFYQGSPFSIMASEEFKNQQEVKAIMENYQRMLDPQSDQNRFTGCFYEKYGQNTPIAAKRLYTQNVPVSVQEKKTVIHQQAQPQQPQQQMNPAQQPLAAPQQQYQQIETHQIVECPTNLYKWLQSMQLNDAQKELYTTQICSVEALLARIKRTRAAMDQAQKRLENHSASMNYVKQSCDDEIQTKLNRVKLGNQQLQNRLINVFGKFEILLNQQGRAFVERGNQDSLISAQAEAIQDINDPQVGIHKKIENIEQKLAITAAQSQQHSHESGLTSSGDNHHQHASSLAMAASSQDFSEGDMVDLFRILKKQKQAMDVLTNSVGDQAQQLMVMDKEINLL